MSILMFIKLFLLLFKQVRVVTLSGIQWEMKIVHLSAGEIERHNDYHCYSILNLHAFIWCSYDVHMHSCSGKLLPLKVFQREYVETISEANQGLKSGAIALTQITPLTEDSTWDFNWLVVPEIGCASAEEFGASEVLPRTKPEAGG